MLEARLPDLLVEESQTRNDLSSDYSDRCLNNRSIGMG